MKRKCRMSPLIACVLLCACGDGSRLSDSEMASIDALETELAAMERQLVESEDISAIKRLMRTYGYYREKGLWEDLAALFTEDGVANLPEGVFVRKDSIRNHFLKNLGRDSIGLPAGQLADHLILQPIVHIDPSGDKAKGRWRAFGMLGQYGESATWTEGVYEAEYAKHGVWRIRTLTYYGSFSSPYEGGWGKKRPKAGPGRQLPHQPDWPRDHRACPEYPDPCLPPFHYANPVSGRSEGES